VCAHVAVCLLYDLSILPSFLSSKKVISRWQEAFFGNSAILMIDYAPIKGRSCGPDFGGNDARGGHAGGPESGASTGGVNVQDDNDGAGPEGLVQMESGGVPIKDRPSQVVVVVADTLLSVEGIRANVVKRRPEDAFSGDSLVLRSPRGSF
jgi:hypothetical protein